MTDTVSKTPRPATGTSAATLAKALRSGALRAFVLPLTAFVVVPFVVHALGEQRFGVWATLSSLVAVGALVDAGVRTEIVRRVARASSAGDLATAVHAVREGVTLLALASASVVALVAVLSRPIVGFVFDLPPSLEADARGLLVGLALVLAVNVINGGMFALAVGLQRTDFENITALSAAVVGSVTTVLLVAGAGLGLRGMLVGQGLQSAVMVVGQLLSTRRLVGVRWPLTRVDRRVARSFFAVSVMMIISQISDVVDVQYDKVVLARYVGEAASGHYQNGSMVPISLRMVALIPLAVVLTGVAEGMRTEPERVERLFTAISALVLSLGGMLLSGAAVFGPAFMRLWLGGDTTQAGDASRLLAVALAVNLVSAPWTGYALGRGWDRTPAAAAAANILVNAVASLWLVTVMGFNGALYGSIIGNVVGSAVFWLLVRRRQRRAWLRPAVRPAALCTCAALLTLLVLRSTDGVEHWWSLTCAATAYALVLSAALVVTLPRALRADAFARLRRS